MNTSLPWSLVVAWAFSLTACQRHEHSHGAGPAPGSGRAHAAEEEPSLSITRWTDHHELFVELSVLRPGKPVRFVAHVTRLEGFDAVTEGTFKVRYKGAAGIAKEAVKVGVKRPGIFVFDSPAPASGRYELEMAYELGSKVDVFDCGSVTVSDTLVDAGDEPASSIAFLKESQWKVPFATAWAEERPLANELELPAVVEPAAGDQLTVGAPTGGRFFHNPMLALAEGLRIEKGDVLGTIAPTVAGDDFTRLEFAVDEARLAREQIQREISRVEPLVVEKLLPERRLVELRNDLETHTAKLDSARARLSRVMAPGGRGGLTIKTTLDGLVSRVLVQNGEPVEAGARLVQIAGTEHLWLRARFVAKPASTFVDAKPSAVRLPTGERIELDARSRFLSPLPVVDANSGIATWIVDVAPLGAPDGGALRDSELRPGSSVVLEVRIGVPAPVLAVPRDAVVEISTRSYLFVQKDGEHFEKRPVASGRSDGRWVQITSGVEKGERIVTQGGYDIHLASLQGALESHRH